MTISITASGLRAVSALAVIGLGVAASTPALAQPAACPGGLGVARVVEIDTAGGPLFGDISRQAKEASFLGPKEVVLTFDDGPMPWITKPILETLDRHCTKATFFSVGRMAIAYPDSVRDVLARGHTLGTHTWSHPLNVPALKRERARDEIERGFAAVALAAGEPIAPFFRFPGLSDSPALLGHLQTRGIASFTVDVVSDDSFISDPRRLTELTLRRIEARQGGIVLFHDIKASTAKALPGILDALAARGYRVVHLRAKRPVTPVADFDPELVAALAKSHRTASGARPPLMPFYGAVGPDRAAPLAAAPVTTIAPEARDREAKVAKATTEKSAADRANAAAAPTRRRTLTAAPAQRLEPQPAVATAGASWSTRVVRRRRVETPTEN